VGIYLLVEEHHLALGEMGEETLLHYCMRPMSTLATLQVFLWLLVLAGLAGLREHFLKERHQRQTRKPLEPKAVKAAQHRLEI
jgi:hypothetical protein